MRRSISFALFALLFSSALADAQNPLLLPPPDSSDLRQMLSALKTQLSQYASAGFSCGQKYGLLPDSVQGSSRALSVVTVDFPEGERLNQSGIAASVDVDSMINNLLKPNAEFTFRRWAILRAQRSALLESNENARIYIEPGTNRISRIIFRGFDTGAHFANFNCQAASR